MPICSVTFLISVVIFGISALGFFKFGGVKVGGIAGGLGAVVLVLSLFGVGC